MRAVSAGLGAVLMSVGCGDPAVDGAYEGEARFEVNGLVCAIGEMRSSTTAMGIAWTTLAPDATRLATLSGEAAPIDAAALPASFELPLFETPPAGTSTAIRTFGGAFDVAIGIPVLFEDLDGDGVLAQDTEPVLGMSRGQLVLYAAPVERGDVTEVPLEVDALPSGWSVAKALCDDTEQLTGLSLLPSATRFDVWLLDGIIDNPLEMLAPKTCLLPF
jgi:hypothetical protein